MIRCAVRANARDPAETRAWADRSETKSPHPDPASVFAGVSCMLFCGMRLPASSPWMRWARYGASFVLLLGTLSSKTALAQPGRSPAVSGSFRLLTYNVAGLPKGATNNDALANLPIIGRLLNRYDIALVQEDFAYPEELRRDIRHPYVSAAFVRGNRLHFGDGLSAFARLPFGEYVRETWRACHGTIDSFFDCLTPKGFARARQVLGTGVTVDVYNLHMDAGYSAHDRAARALQLDQLADAILRDSAGRAVIVAGDTNISNSERELLEKFERRTGLTDLCRRLPCPGPWRIDRVLFRGGDRVELFARSWRLDSAFVDRSRRPLSDHPALAVQFAWRALRTERIVLR